MVLRRRAGLTAALAALLGGAAHAHSGANNWEQSLADLVVFATALAVVLGFGWQGLAPVFRSRTSRVLVGLLLAALLAAVLKGTLWKAIAPPPPPPESFSSRSERGGAVARAGSFFVELSRSGDEFRVWLSDELRRPIEPRFFPGVIRAGNAAAPLEPRAGHRAARLPVRPPTTVTAELELPGGPIRLEWSMDETGRLVHRER